MGALSKAHGRLFLSSSVSIIPWQRTWESFQTFHIRAPQTVRAVAFHAAFNYYANTVRPQDTVLGQSLPLSQTYSVHDQKEAENAVAIAISSRSGAGC